MSHPVWATSLLMMLLANPADGAEILFEQGTLQRGDRRLANDEYYDEFTFEGLAGQRISIEVSSPDFNTWVILRFPGGETVENDNYGDERQSVVRTALPEDGTYAVSVTSLEGFETGSYKLIVQSDDTGFAIVNEGSLSRTDGKLENGELYDTYSIQGQAGQRLELRLLSDDFTTYLMLESPDGSVVEDHDETETSNDSALRTVLPAGGEYLVHVTSLSPGETGNYRLVMDQGSLLGSTQKGRLQNGDEMLESGEFLDVYTFDGVRGEVLDVLVVSNDFDPYVMIVTPNGEQFETDDLEVGSPTAGLRLPLTRSGEYEIYVTSYEEGEVGQYYLSTIRE